MKKISAALFGVAFLSAAISSAAAPAFALGGCGANFHRDAAGRCVWGGQDEHWCLNHTGHAAQPGPHGTWVCYR